MERIVIALGGNALDSGGTATAEEQLRVARETCERIADIIVRGYAVGLVHGNGPQVGRILLASETAREVTPPMPFDVCGAMSQGYIGYQLQQSLQQALQRRGCSLPVWTAVTQVAVNASDPAFAHPSKPIGPFYTREEAEKLTGEKGYVMQQDAGRGWRRVVPSPHPERIVEINAIRALWDSSVVISCGGGGIPVTAGPDGELKGVAAVIDKDFAAELLAEQVDARKLMILTAVEQVCLRFGRPDEVRLKRMTCREAEAAMAAGEFAPGSMLPKVQAAVRFVRVFPDRQAVITSLDRAVDALEGRAGTAIVFE